MAFDKLGRFFGIAEDDELDESSYIEEPEVEEKEQPMKNERRTNVVSINSVNTSDAKEVAQNLLSNKAVIINFARMDDTQSRRIVDFITGTVYALNGEIQRVGDKIFLATPPKFETDGKIAELVEKKDNLN